MFLGEHRPRLDDKGRLTLPAKFREELADGVVVTKGLERCLFVFPRAEFAKVTTTLGSAPFTEPKARTFGRVLFASASEEPVDKQGRITIVPPLRSYAGLTKDCVVIGNNTRLEIWDTASWDAYLAENEPAFAELQTEVMPGVF